MRQPGRRVCLRGAALTDLSPVLTATQPARASCHDVRGALLAPLCVRVRARRRVKYLSEEGSRGQGLDTTELANALILMRVMTLGY